MSNNHTTHFDDCGCISAKLVAAQSESRHLERQRDTWGNEFNAVIIMKDRLANEHEQYKAMEGLRDMYFDMHKIAFAKLGSAQEVIRLLLSAVESLEAFSGVKDSEATEAREALAKLNIPEFPDSSNVVTNDTSSKHVAESGKQGHVPDTDATRLRKVLEDVRDAVNEQECRGDEDCDHCQIVHHMINPVLAEKECTHPGREMGAICDECCPIRIKRGDVKAVKTVKIKSAKEPPGAPSTFVAICRNCANTGTDIMGEKCKH